MRILMLFFLVGFMHVYATGRSQTITWRGHNHTLTEALDALREQSGYAVSVDKSLLRKARPVNIEAKQISVERFLALILENQGLEARIENKTVILSPKFLRDEVLTANGGLILAYTEVRGRVVDSLGQPLVGATVRVLDASGRRTALAATTDREGVFLLRNVPEDAQLEFSFVGYVRQVIPARADVGPIVLRAVPSTLEEVEVMVNTGYQQLPKERATGSFVQFSNEELNLRTGSTLLERLEDMVPGLQVNRISGNTPQLNVRGLTTFSASLANNLLIILDKFPYDGDLDNINPDDIESITLLRDAAAASIWGARAGHGVLVINTKQPTRMENKSLSVSVSGNTTIIPPDNLLKTPRIRSSDFIDLEIDLFEKGYYDADLAVPDQRTKIYSPVITLLSNVRKGTISEQEAYSQIDQMRGHEYRQELMDHVFRDAVRQQYSMNISGSSTLSDYMVSTGFATAHDNVKLSGQNSRFNMRAAHNFRPISKLSIHTALNYTGQFDAESDAYQEALTMRPSDSHVGLYPYARLISDAGDPLSIPYKYNPGFVDTAGNGKLLDWTYRPLDVSNRDWSKRMNLQHIQINTEVKYELLPGWGIDLTYGHERQLSILQQHQSQDQFVMTDKINRFTQIINGTVVRPVPLGGLYTVTNGRMANHRFRMQSAFNKIFAERHAISALAGSEISHRRTMNNGYQRYGYNEDTYTVAADIDYVGTYPVFGGLGGNQRLDASLSQMSDGVERFISFYTNASYIFDHKYILSVSGRQDAANMFGIKANHLWNPLWSVGASWNMDRESFMQRVNWIDQLKFRLTYGYGGTPPNGAPVRPILIIRPSGHSMYPELPFAIVGTPANGSLKWENVRMTNMAVDFSLFKGRLGGSFEYFTKLSTDIVTSYPLPSGAGRSSIPANVGDLKGEGFDVQLDIVSHIGAIQWNKKFSLSHSWNQVQQVYVGTPSPTTYIGTQGTLRPLIGKSLYPVFMYRFEGLDPDTGYPIGYLDGQPSTNYQLISSQTKVLEEADYHGTLLPPYYGFFRNTIEYRDMVLTFNITYKAGHVFARKTFDGSISAWNSHSDYYLRWQKPGDELITNVPAYAYPAVPGMMDFYQRSSAVIEKGDEVRLQDVRLAYQFRVLRGAQVQVFSTMSNAGLLWRASNNDYGIPPARTFSLGIQANWK